MKGLLLELLDFFKKEKGYTAILLLVLSVYVYVNFFSKNLKTYPSSESPVIEEYRQAEMALKQKIEASGSPGEFLKEHPEYAPVFHTFSFTAGGALCLGFLLEFYLFFSPGFRRSISIERPKSLVHWNLGMLLRVMVLFLLFSTALSFLLGFIMKALLPGFSQNFYLLLHTLSVDILSFVLIYRTVKKGGGGLSDMGLSVPSKNIFKEALVGLGAYLAVLPIFLAVMLFSLFIAELIHYEPPAHALVTVFLEEEKSPWITAFSIVMGTIAGPLLEEIFFRGFCYNIFKHRLGVVPAMMSTSIFFALIHANAFAFWPIFVLGMGLAYVYEKRGSVIASTVLHITHNAVFIAYFFMAKDVVARSGGL